MFLKETLTSKMGRVSVCSFAEGSASLFLWLRLVTAFDEGQRHGLPLQPNDGPFAGEQTTVAPMWGFRRKVPGAVQPQRKRVPRPTGSPSLPRGMASPPAPSLSRQLGQRV